MVKVVIEWMGPQGQYNDIPCQKQPWMVMVVVEWMGPQGQYNNIPCQKQPWDEVVLGQTDR